MEVNVTCTTCGRSFAINLDDERGWWVSCPACNKSMRLHDAIRPLFQRYPESLEFQIECGRLSAYLGHSRHVTLPSSVSIIEGGERNEVSLSQFLGFELRKGCFEDSDIESIEFPPSLREIEQYAFANCRHLRRVILPEGLVRIGRCAFANCTSLEEVQIPITCRFIHWDSFAGCKSLRTVRIVNSASEYLQGSGSAGRGVARQQYATTRDSLLVADGAFYGCEMLRSVNFFDGQTSIGNHCFHGCASLKEFDIPSKTAYIGESAFEGCTGISELHLPEDNGDSKLVLGCGCFKGMKGLRRINIPDNATFENGCKVFEGCSSLANVDISDKALRGNSRSLRGNLWQFEGTPFYDQALRRLFEMDVPELKELNAIKRDLQDILSELKALERKLDNLGLFDRGEKKSLRSEIVSLRHKRDELADRGKSIDTRDLRRKIESACYVYRISFKDTFCKCVDNGWSSDSRYYSFSDWCNDNFY